MNINQVRALTARLAERIATNTGDEASSMLTEDVADFLSPQRAELEMRRFFRETPQVVGFAGELAEPHSWLTAEVVGVPILVTRDASGELHAAGPTTVPVHCLRGPAPSASIRRTSARALPACPCRIARAS